MIPSLDLFPISILRPTAIYVGLISFLLSSIIFLLFKVKKDSVVITNNMVIALGLSFFHSRLIYELHDYPGSSRWLYARMFKRVAKIQTNNFQKIKLLENDFGISRDKIVALHNGVNLEDFEVDHSKESARKSLDLDLTTPLVVYTGHLYDWKGADLLAQVAEKSPNIQFLFVGGTNTDLIRMNDVYGETTNVKFIGHRPHDEMPLYLKAADVLVLPNTAKKEISRLHTSPMKVFEYMASGTPIIASDIPSIREILNENNAFFFEPDSQKALGRSIDYVLSHVECAKKCADQARVDVRDYTWNRRSKKLIKIIQSL